MASTDSVRRFLVTGPDENLQRFHVAVAFHKLNYIERREQTLAYTCFAEDADFALQVAEHADVTVQEIEFAGDAEQYPTLRAGSHGMKWTRKAAS